LILQIFDNPDLKPQRIARGVGLGFFDGVHRGHLELLRTLVFKCRQSGLSSAVFTFPDHPEAVLRPDEPFDEYLCDLDDRLALLAACGLDETHLQPFDLAFAAIEPQAFLQKILVERLQANLIVVGHDYRFGRFGAGDVSMLKSWAAEREIQVVVVDEVTLYGERISSSCIRNLIGIGDMVKANSLLGRPYSLSGFVVSGRQLGRRLGFPTANFPVDNRLVCPAYGVYATRTHVGDRVYDSVTNVGLRPTVEQDRARPIVETYLYEADLTLYGQNIQVDFLERIRPEVQFASVAELGEHVGADLLAVRSWHERAEQCHVKANVQNIPLNVLSTRRFAQASLQLIFLIPLEKRRSSGMALLLRTLTASCRRYPTRTSLAAALDSQYGSSIEAHLEKQGDLQAISLTGEGLMRWTDGSSPFGETCALLFDVLLDPLVDENGLFDSSIVETERQNLLLELAARENDRAKYAYDRCLLFFCGDQVQGLSPVGDKQSLEEISLEELREAYTFLLHQTSLSAYLGGHADSRILDICLEGLKRLPQACRPVYHPAVFPSPFKPAEPAGRLEHKAVEQARLALAYVGLPPYFSHRTIIASVLNSMLGGDVHSLLFDVVREQMGLAYSVFSMNQRSLSALFVMAGVASDQITAALDAIRRQLAALATGDFEASLLERSRQMLETSILSVNDDLSSLMAQRIIGNLYGRNMTREESLSLLNSVTCDHIREMASQLKLVTCYVLCSPDQKPDLSVSGLQEPVIIDSEVQP
jgi:riboflavin kinase / FMN adenylyltransferase